MGLVKKYLLFIVGCFWMFLNTSCTFKNSGEVKIEQTHSKISRKAIPFSSSAVEITDTTHPLCNDKFEINEEDENELFNYTFNARLLQIMNEVSMYETSGDISHKHNAENILSNLMEYQYSFFDIGLTNNYLIGNAFLEINEKSEMPSKLELINNLLNISSKCFTWDASNRFADFYENIAINYLNDICNEQHIYYRNTDDIFVFQYHASKVFWKDKNTQLVQETEYPQKDMVKFTIACNAPVKFALNLRNPFWCQDGLQVSVNGKKCKTKKSSDNFVSINKKWENGDIIEVKIPFNLHTETLPTDDNRIVIMNGPFLLARDLEADISKNISPSIIPVIRSETKDPKSWVMPVEGKNNIFKTVGVGYPQDLLLKPYYLLRMQQSQVSWEIYTEELWEERFEKYQADLLRYTQE